MDFYLVLGVERGASPSDIKRAYRRLARRYHPDINPGDRVAEAFFRRVVEAYETLIDPDRRRRYDQAGPPSQAPAAPSFEFDGFDFSVMAEGAHASTFGELFADIFRGPRGGAEHEAERGADLHASVSLTFDEAMRGAERQLTLTRLETCGTCGGSGQLRTAEGRCLQCRGLGTVRVSRGHMVFSKACADCGGTGRQQHRACPACGGEGTSPRSETLAVKIPPGVSDGSRIRVPGKGNIGGRSGAAGDLQVTVQVAPHPALQRTGDDLYMTVPIAVHEAALGAKVEIPTLDGPARLRVPPGTQSGQRFRMRERGAPSPRGGRRGDLVVEVRLVLPRIADERSKELLREFGRLNNENVRKELWESWPPNVQARRTT